MTTPSDPFVGTWTLNPARSTFDAHHRPTEGTMVFEGTADGQYLMNAHGKNEKGEPVTERPVRFIPDGRPYPVPGAPGIAMIVTQPDHHTIRSEARTEDGKIVGSGTMVVSADGQSLTANTTGVDTEQRQFTLITVWER